MSKTSHTKAGSWISPPTELDTLWLHYLVCQDVAFVEAHKHLYFKIHTYTLTPD